MLTSTDLKLKRDEHKALVDNLSAELSKAIFSDDQTEIEKLEAKLGPARDRLIAFDAAIENANEVEAREELKRQRAARSQSYSEAEENCEKLFEKASKVDERLLMLGEAHSDFLLQMMVTQTALRKAGLADTRLPNTSKAALRWAAHLLAPSFCTDSQVPRVPQNRQRAFAQSIATMLPVTPEEEVA